MVVTRNLVRNGAILATLLLPVAIADASTTQERAAIPPVAEDIFTRCLDTGDAARGSMGGIIACEREEFARVDAELNRVYRLALAKTSGKARQRLIARERAWIDRKVRRCDRGRNLGMDEISDKIMCEIQETKTRTGHLMIDYGVQ